MDNTGKVKIFTVLKDGEVLDGEVLRCVAWQNIPCVLVPITSKGKKMYSENNRRKNVLRALAQNKEDFFILMDSDVVLGDFNIIADLIDDKKNVSRDIVSCTTKGEKVATCTYIPHALILVQRRKLKEFRKYMRNYKVTTDGKEDCAICSFIGKNINDCMTLQNDKIYETANRNI